MPDEIVSILSPYDVPGAVEWDRYVAANKHAHGYHRLIWCSIIREAFDHASYPLAARRNGRICGVLPLVLVSGRLFGNFLVSMPFVNYGGVLADDEEAGSALMRAAETLRDKLGVRSVELRLVGADEPDRPAEPCLQKTEDANRPGDPRLAGAKNRAGGSDEPDEKLFRRAHKVTMLLDLQPHSEDMWRKLKDTVRNQTRKALKSGLEAVVGGAELLDEFYDIFCVNMRALGTPVYGKNFFASVLRNLPEETAVLVVRQNGKNLASGIVYSHGRVMEMPWASSLPRARQLCPNNLLYWTAITRAIAEGREIFDFGRSTSGSGPWRFKMQWGPREVPLYWDYILAPGAPPPNLSADNPRYSLASRAWQHLPLALTKMLGPAIVRGIP